MGKLSKEGDRGTAWHLGEGDYLLRCIKGCAKSADTLKTKITIDKNVIVKVSIVEDKKKKQSTLEVKYGELESILNGRLAQFAMF